MTENANVTKAAGIVGVATLSSRILGFIRDMILAGFFGAGFYSDAFITAFRIPNLLRKLFAEGSLSIAFIPVFTRYLKKTGRNGAFEMARSIIYVLFILLFFITAAGIIFAPEIIYGIAFGLTDSPEKYALTVLLTRIMFPYIIFICILALFMGMLNALDHFTAPALAPCLLNISMISAVIIVSFFSKDPHDLIIGLSIGVLVGGGLQILFQIPVLVKKKFVFFSKASFSHPGLKEIGQMLPPAVFSAGVYQLNILISTFLATLLSEGCISYLYYADRLVQFPLGIFAISVATAVLPSLSRQAEEHNIPGVKQTFAYGLRLIFFIILPSMVGLIVLRRPIISLLFQRGAFDAEAVMMTASALFYYCLGLWAIAAVRIIVPVFYALRDTKTPVLIAMISIVANIFFSVILMPTMGHGGLALSTSLASILNLSLLLAAMHKRLGALGLRKIMSSFIKSASGSLLMGIIVWFVSSHIVPKENVGDGILGFGIFCSIFFGILFYGGFSFFVKNPEFEYVLTLVRKGKSKD